MNSSNIFHILIVDDERSNLDVLAHILKSQYTVQIAKSGAAALKRAKEQQPDLILLDIVMQDMNGFEVLAELKNYDETRHIPVIFITGLSQPEDEEKGFLLGAVDYIHKPFKPSIVKARVRTHLRIVNQMRTIERLCLIDALTEIPNRRSFDQQMDMEWSRAMRDDTPLSLLSLDVDKFKSFNDTYGHPQGDILLHSLAHSFTTVLNLPSEFVARVGGEEFAVILPNIDLQTAMVLAEELRKTVESMEVPTLDNAGTLSVTISIGAASVMPNEHKTIGELITSADTALYQAKNSGRNRVCAAE